MADSNAARGVLLDAFSRVHEMVPQVLDGVGDQLGYRPDGHGNSIGWLVWHLTRVQDDHFAGLAGVEQAWVADGWYERFGLPFAPEEHGYGHTSEQVDAVGGVTVELLTGYHEATDALTRRYLEAADDDELARVVDTNWDPPVTAAVRIVSVIGDCAAHIGQADYVRGLIQARQT